MQVTDVTDVTNCRKKEGRRKRKEAIKADFSVM
jgi:hypothetical protein